MRKTDEQIAREAARKSIGCDRYDCYACPECIRVNGPCTNIYAARLALKMRGRRA